ncbi:MAG: 50S ribosomal protein L21 [Planctomycetes bacterium]|jgi:large subunit ribosomal protein L21|nr:50S ribosomal protein L21 [Planctomycetota bacterium]
MKNKIAVIKTGGKQYKVKEGQTITVEKIKSDEKEVVFDTLLLADLDGQEVKIGEPLLKEKVKGEIVATGKGDKVMVVKFKNKTRYKRTIGHRQQFAKIKILGLV